MKKKSLIALISILCFAFNFSAKATTISTNTTWSTGTVPTITGNLEIANGATLTITGNHIYDVPANIIIDAGAKLVVTNFATLYMKWIGVTPPHPPLASITVDAGNSTTWGGQLVVNNNAIIDGDYDASHFDGWGGIYVVGLGSSSPQGIESGSATFTNATVTHAIYGVTNFDATNDPTGSTTGGGIIQATSSTFTDNQADVIMQNYLNVATGGIVRDDNGFFQLCTFSTTGTDAIEAPGGWMSDVPYGNYYGGYMAYLSNMEGVKFRGCTFNNNPSEGIFGIYATNAGFNLTHYCTVPYPGSSGWGTNCNGGVETRSAMNGFTSVHSSVYATNAVNYHKVAITFTDFANTSGSYVYSVYLSGCINPVITNNTALVPGQTNQTAGFFLKSCTGYTFLQNTFTGYGNGAHTNAIGAVFQSSGPNYNLANSNTFQNLNYAQQAEDINMLFKSPAGQTGLQLLCNDMSSNTLSNNTDISTTYSTTSLLSNDGVNPAQGHASGSSFTDAENKFSSSAALYNYYNGDQAMKYYASSSSLPDFPVKNTGITTQITSGASCPIPSGISVIPVLSHSTYVAHISPAITAVASFVTGAPGRTSSDPNPYMPAYCLLVDSVSNGFLYGDTTSKLDSIAMVLQGLPYNYDYQVRLAGLYVQQNNFSLALTTLANIITTDSLDTPTNNQLKDLIYAYGIMGKLHSDTSKSDTAKWHHLTTGEVDTLSDIDTTDVSYAQAVTHYLFSHYTYQFYTPVWQEIGNNNNDGLGQLNRMAQVTHETGNTNIQVYPNPLDNTLNINVPEGRQCQYIIMDASGRTVLTNLIQTGLNTIDTHNLQPGFYLLEVSGNGMATYIRKLLKK